MKLIELRKKYPEFIFSDFNYNHKDNEIVIRFHFISPPDIEFKPEIIIDNVSKSVFDKLDKAILDNLIFHLGIIELFSYWKAFCSPKIIIKAGNLDSFQIRWWKELLLDGMGQYFYENKIDFTKDAFLNISVEGNAIAKKAKILGEMGLVPVGGGKDSAVTLAIVKKLLPNIGAGILEGVNVKSGISASLSLAKESGIKDMILVKRVFDKRLIELNKSGYLNGHTPFSAYLAFLFVLCGYIFDYKYLIFSNERSSDEENAIYLGRKINHQYSKSFEFEKLFRDYNLTYLSNIEYFSFLRPLYEIQIAKLFSHYRKYFGLIRSCNVGKAEGVWCQKCSKCLSTYMLLYPFLGKEIFHIFSKDLYQDPNLSEMVKRLTDKSEEKPFECVGTKKELSIAKNFTNRKDDLKQILAKWGENNLPKKFEEALRREINE